MIKLFILRIIFVGMHLILPCNLPQMLLTAVEQSVKQFKIGKINACRLIICSNEFQHQKDELDIVPPHAKL